MNSGLECYRGVVYPWHCDQFDHMNVMHYVGMFDQGTLHLLAAAGWSQGADNFGVSFADVKHVVEYKSELRAGALVTIEGAVRRIGTKSVTFVEWMKRAHSDEMAAIAEITCVCLDQVQRRSVAIPGKVRTGLQSLVEAGPE
ncbi:MAG: acyl-CoA thioesterase [Candidatus Hydrogenedentes bacterium]|nr:acyl-CoA thioesterase [Candidatus Hydrogenedentota bacterium]